MLVTELATDILHQARQKGATEADVVVMEEESFTVTVRLGKIDKLQNAREKRLGIRIFTGKSSAVTSTADFSPAGIDHLVTETCALARATAPDVFSGLPSPGELAHDQPDLDLFDQQAKTLSLERRIALATEAEAAAFHADTRVTNSEGAEFSSGFHNIVYANSHGFLGQYRTSSFSLTVVPVASQDGCLQRDYWFSAHRKIDGLEPPDTVGKKAAERTVRRLGARKIKTQEAPIIFDPFTAASLLRHLAMALSGTALYQGTSFLLGKLGEQIASEHVSIVDNGLLPAALGSRPFDGEGIATRRNQVIENGFLRGYLLDTYSARKLGMHSTGNASRSLGDAPVASPSNLYLEPGQLSPEEIIASTDRGLYVTELIGFGVNPVTGDYSRGAVGMWIEKGELTYPVEEITIAGNLLDMFRDIAMVGSDLEFRSPVVAPTVKISRMTIAGN